MDAPLSTWKREATPVLVLGAALLAPAAVLGGGLEGHAPLLFLVGLLGLAAAFVWQSERPVRMLALAAVMFALTQFYELGLSHVVYARSFFGVHKIVDFADGKARLLFHGAIVHGAERLTTNDGAPVAGRPEQLTYYYQGGPFEEAIDAARAAQGGRLPRVALVGLGVGALACSRAPGESWSIYEIDPELVRISTQSGLFRTMPTCGADMRVIVGDARLTLTDAREPFDLIDPRRLQLRQHPGSFADPRGDASLRVAPRASRQDRYEHHQSEYGPDGHCRFLSPCCRPCGQR